MNVDTQRYLSLTLTQCAQAFAKRDELSKLLADVLRLGAQMQVIYDHSEVMKSPCAYQAVFDHKAQQIILNAHFIAAAPEPLCVERFLTVHELFHALETQRGIAATHQSELLADEVAILATLTEDSFHDSSIL